jgi:hypothetical protein
LIDIVPLEVAMSKVLIWLIAGALACSGTAASANCACQCIEGVARTLCTTLDEAQANPSKCGAAEQKVACDAAPSATGTPQRYEPPRGAVDCRGARLWDPQTNGYTFVAKVCDLDRDVVVGE